MTNNKWLKFFQARHVWLNAVGAGSIDAFQTYHKLRLIFMHANEIHLIKMRRIKKSAVVVIFILLCNPSAECEVLSLPICLFVFSTVVCSGCPV